MTVYIAQTSQCDVYHTDKDCGALKHSKGIREAELENIPHRELCGLCDGHEPFAGNPYRIRNKLAETDPEDVGV